MNTLEHFDIIVIGGGHAGIEASIASAKMGAKTLLITILVEQIGAASCNPAIGGLGKGHLVKEIDALGGVMGELTDMCGIQFRTLNASKGPAVRGTRAQIDMDRYKIHARNFCYKTQNLTITQQLVTEILVDNTKCVKGVKTALGKVYSAKKIILTTGTFLEGKIHIGESTSQNGRAGEPAASELGKCLKNLGLKVGRLKTGTCARIAAKSIDFSLLEVHNGDTPAPHFSSRTESGNGIFCPTQLPCYVTYTNEQTHKIIQDNKDKAPLFSGQIKGVGPRYCPSIEDKVYRFSDKDRHQLFLEPQTLEANEYYINGLTTSLPYDIQEKMIRTIKGLEKAQIIRYGYAIEYDFVYPTELNHTLECKNIKGLYCAGQINGTTGYEEAAALGLFAGINATLSVQNRTPFILKRNEAYLGVMVDDLVTKGTEEPYRMFSSRAEYRLILREGNAIFRLGDYAFEFGLITTEEHKKIKEKERNIQEGLLWLENTTITPTKQTLSLLETLEEEKISDKITLKQLCARKSFTTHKLRQLDSRFCQLSHDVLEEILTECKYAIYIHKSQSMLDNMESLLAISIPSDFSYEGISGLSLEVIEKLQKHRPPTLFAASRISGITPASLEVLQLYIHLYHKNKSLHT